MISKVLFTDFRDFEHLNRFSSLFTCVFVCLLLSDHNETSGSFQKKGCRPKQWLAYDAPHIHKTRFNHPESNITTENITRQPQCQSWNLRLALVDQDNNQKHATKTSKKNKTKNIKKVLKYPRQSPGLRCFGLTLKRLFVLENPELKQFCQ